MAVGAWGGDDDGTNSGSAYVFSRNQGGADNWGQAQKITAPDAEQDDNFGCALAVDGDVLVIGSRGDDDKGVNAGAAYLHSSAKVVSSPLAPILYLLKK